MASPETEIKLQAAVRLAWQPLTVPRRSYRRNHVSRNFQELAQKNGVRLSDEANAAFEESIEYRKMGRLGSEAVALAYAATQGHPAACLLLAGTSFVRAMDHSVVNARAEYLRALGWLQSLDLRRFKQDYLRTFTELKKRKKSETDFEDCKISAFRRLVEWNEGKLTVISNLIQKPRFENHDGARYLRLNSPMSFRGMLTEELTQRLLDTVRYEYPWATELSTELENALILTRGTGAKWIKLPPILIVGPPGTGKTRLARRIAEVADLPYQLINFSGSADNRDLAGTSKGWGSASPSRICEVFIDTESPNPIVLLDEIDKATRDTRNGDALATLLTMLAPETQRRFRDEALGTEFDLQYVNWIATANSLTGLGRPLLSRLRVVKLTAPPPSAAERLVEVGVREFALVNRLDSGTLPEIQPTVREALVQAMVRGATPRALSNMIGEILAIEMKSIRARAH
jgi:hypothetical protein